MKTYYEVMSEIYVDHFDVVIRLDGTREYRHYLPMSITHDGKVTNLGITYGKDITLVSADDMTMIDVVDMDEETYDKLYFVEDPDEYCRLIGANVKDLIGCDREFFNEEANRRARGET